ncbi:MAG: hypothetical protein KC517_09375 [Bacteroidetes bacterium]|nr:hypothetical protein [Bacteroidota bacterium]
MIREGLLDSKKFNKLTEEEQMFFVRLMLVVDDYGRYDARPELIKSRCYPVTTNKDLSDVSKMLSSLDKSQMITLYTVNSKEYLEIIDYNQRLRQKKEKYPSPARADVSIVRADVSIVRPEEKRSRREVELEVELEENLICVPFETFWNLYDKKVNPKLCRKMWKSLSDSEREAIIKIIPDYKKANPDKKYRKDPERYLKKRSWEDEIIKNYNETKNQYTPADMLADSQRPWLKKVFTDE